MNSVIATTLAERLAELGGIAPNRLRLTPAPGQATVEDLIRSNERQATLCELVGNALVEKAMGFEASVVAMAIVEALRRFVVPRKLGVISGPDGMFRLLPDTVRGPGVAFVSRSRLPGGVLPSDSFPGIAPDLAIEVLSLGNTKGEMSRKRIEYFHSGVQLVWIVDCRSRSVAVYTSPSAVTEFAEEHIITGGTVLSGFEAKVADFFTDLDFGQCPTA